MVTMDGSQGAELAELIDADATIPVHYNDYTVFASPLADFTAAIQARGLGERVTYVKPGDTVSLPVIQLGNSPLSSTVPPP